ncbi:MAG: FAD:protein FMN transferase [Gammaproteobacteria bacterium]|nr:FAD:protein FMN transferase [Gammaproteobacteria bacterium]
MLRTQVASLNKSPRINLFLCVVLVAGITACQQAQIHQQQYLQFGTIIDISLIADDWQAVDATFAAIDQLLQQRHQQWHAWLPGSLQDFNQALVKDLRSAVAVPPELNHLIQLSKQYHELSDGLFNPAIGKLVAAWGFHQQQPPDLELIALIQRDIPTMWDLLLENDQALSLNPHLQLDFGAVAKGTAIKQIAALLQQRHIEHFIINAGGDVYALGHKHQRPWRVAIEDPYQQGVIATLDLPSAMSIFTSGNYRRFYLDANQQRRHHIIDPRSGEPSTQISAATVLHADPEIADIAATTLMLSETSQIKETAARLGIDDFLVLTEQKQAYVSESMLNKIEWQESQLLNVHRL